MKQLKSPSLLKSESNAREDELKEVFTKLATLIQLLDLEGTRTPKSDWYEDEDEYQEALTLSQLFAKEIDEFIEDEGVLVGIANHFREYVHIK